MTSKGNLMHKDFSKLDVENISIVPSNIEGMDITHIIVRLFDERSYGGAFRHDEVMLDLAECVENLKPLGE